MHDTWKSVPAIVSDDELMNETIEVMSRLNMVGVLSALEPDRTAKWVAAAPERFIQAAVLQFGPSGPNFTVESLRSLHAAGKLSVLGEVISHTPGLNHRSEFTSVPPNRERFISAQRINRTRGGGSRGSALPE